MGLTEANNKPKTGKFWFLFLILGIFAIILGIYFMMNFGAGFSFIALIVSIYFLVTGIISCFAAIQNRGLPGWVLSLILSIILLIVGIIIITDYFTSWTVSISGFLVLVFCGIGLIAEAISLIAGALSLRGEEGSSWVLTLILGIILLIVSFIVIGNPILSIALINVFVSVGVLVFGITSIVMAFQLKKIRDALK